MEFYVSATAPKVLPEMSLSQKPCSPNLSRLANGNVNLDKENGPSFIIPLPWDAFPNSAVFPGLLYEVFVKTHISFVCLEGVIFSSKQEDLKFL